MTDEEKCRIDELSNYVEALATETPLFPLKRERAVPAMPKPNPVPATPLLANSAIRKTSCIECVETTIQEAEVESMPDVFTRTVPF